MPVQRHSLAERQNMNEAATLPPTPSRQRTGTSRPRLPSPDEVENDLPPPIPKRKSESPLESYNKSRERRPLADIDSLDLEGDVTDAPASGYPTQTSRSSFHLGQEPDASDAMPPAHPQSRRKERPVPLSAWSDRPSASEYRAASTAGDAASRPRLSSVDNRLLTNRLSLPPSASPHARSSSFDQHDGVASHSLSPANHVTPSAAHATSPSVDVSLRHSDVMIEPPYEVISVPVHRPVEGATSATLPSKASAVRSQLPTSPKYFTFAPETSHRPTPHSHSPVPFKPPKPPKPVSAPAGSRASAVAHSRSSSMETPDVTRSSLAASRLRYKSEDPGVRARPLSQLSDVSSAMWSPVDVRAGACAGEHLLRVSFLHLAAVSILLVCCE